MATDDPLEEFVYCVRCGAANHIESQFCAQCGTRLVYHQAAERPGCVTVYVIFALLGPALVICGLSSLSDTYRISSGNLLFLLVVTGIQLIGLVGLWRMKNWGRIIILIFGVIGLLGNLLTLTGDASGGLICGTLIGAAIDVYILYWFWSHGELFE